MSQAGTINSSGSIIGSVLTLTGNSGGAVGPDGSGNIDVLGNNTAGINIVGNPGTNTLTVTAYQATTTQQGTVLLATNAQTIAGTDANNAVTSASLAAKLGTQTAHSLSLFQGPSSALTPLGVATNGQIPIGSTGVDPVLANITSTGGTITVTNGPGTINIDLVGGHGAIEQFLPDSGTTPVVPNGSGQVTMAGSGSTTTVGGLNSLTFELTGLTNHNVLVGAGTTTITKVAPSATSGVPLISQGASSDPAFGTAVVAGGGTGATSFTAYSPICGGTSTTGALQSASTGMSTSGFVLTSTGTSSLPTWQATAVTGITTINGDSGSITGTTVTIYANQAAIHSGSTVSFTNSGTISTLNVTDGLNNTIIGSLAGNASISAVDCVGLGQLALHALTSGSYCTAVGMEALQSCTSGQDNVGIGQTAASSLISGGSNTAIGTTAMANVTTGSNNTIIGVSAGSAYTGAESSNILISAGSTAGTLGESNVLRIGTNGSSTGQQSKCFIAGIEGVSVSNAQMVTINTSTSQLGSQAIPSTISWSDTSGTVTAVAFNGYFITGATTSTLPSSPTEGDTISYVVDTASTLTITASTGKIIRIGAALSAATGTAANNARGDSVTLVYRSTGTTWFATSVIGTWTVT